MFAGVRQKALRDAQQGDDPVRGQEARIVLGAEGDPGRPGGGVGAGAQITQRRLQAIAGE
ncbi:hypothetical protein [Streptomyces phaeochromogenes]|uniref:hypothetical protein n=1 Tax=Streptomyces phaeochromogenes TaxID=1923 RepID=UPI00386A22FE|nr:hypothetical protein OG277_52295 [Streptomyces phaeochromogenes]